MCQRYGGGAVTRPYAQQTMQVGEPFERIGVDLVEPLPGHEFRWIMVVTEHSSRFAWARGPT